MALYVAQPVANGLRTDHPVPDLPFVDDSHLPLDDPQAIEAIGRRHAKDYNGWGRTDPCGAHGWVAFTTDQTRPELAWMVRYHPEYGRSVLVLRNEDMSLFHSVMAFEARQALLFRAGGYWWDGETWYRPAQIWDWAEETYFRRPVPSAVTVTAGDLLQNGGDATRARLLRITDLDLQDPSSKHWLDDLALWASGRDDRGLGDNVVKLAAPELTGDQLIGVAQMAELAGIAASTLRAYIARGENDVPLPQVTIGRRALWARPVAEEWVEARNRSREGIAGAVAANRDGSSLPVGISDLWDRLRKAFMSALWERPDWRKRWAIRWRTETAVRDIAEELSWSVAANLNSLIPMPELAHTIEHAVLDELAVGLDLEEDCRGKQIDWNELSDRRAGRPKTKAEWYSFGISVPVAQMLDWLIRHDPALAGRTLASIVRSAQDRFGIPRQVTERTLATALSLDGSLDETTRENFLNRIFAPDTTT